MSEKKNFWTSFAEKHPSAAKWIREGGLFVIVSNVITVFKYLILQFLPKLLTNLPDKDFGWPGIDMTLFGETFKWNILGYDQAHGGLRYLRRPTDDGSGRGWVKNALSIVRLC